MALHVLVGENAVEAEFQACARRGKPYAGWVVPKKAQSGDDAIFVFHRDQFMATGVIDENPSPDGTGIYRASVRDLRLFTRSLPVADAAIHLRAWRWPDSYSKGRTTVPPEIAPKLYRVVEEHIARVGVTTAGRGGSSPNDARKKLPELRTRPKDPGEPKDVKLSRPQIEAFIREQTSGATLGAEGRKFLRTHIITERKASNRKFILELRGQRGELACDACGIDLAKRYGPEHREVLELHHRVPLARGPRKPTGTEAFALLCPTCHRVVHYRREDPLRVEVLRARLTSSGAA